MSEQRYTSARWVKRPTAHQVYNSLIGEKPHKDTVLGVDLLTEVLRDHVK